MKESWADNLDENQQCIMNVLGGFISDIADLMAILTRQMDEKTAHLVKLGYINALMNALELEAKNDRN